MNKSLLKFLTDFGPLLIFFIVYSRSGRDLGVAIPPLIISTLIAVIIMYLVDKKIPYIPLLGAFLVSFFGGLALYFNNPIFIYLKPTIINLLFGMTLIIARKFFDKNFLQIFFKTAFQLTNVGWDKLNYRWAFFLYF